MFAWRDSLLLVFVNILALAGAFTIGVLRSFTFRPRLGAVEPNVALAIVDLLFLFS
jgi:hypothetical protein